MAVGKATNVNVTVVNVIADDATFLSYIQSARKVITPARRGVECARRGVHVDGATLFNPSATPFGQETHNLMSPTLHN